MARVPRLLLAVLVALAAVVLHPAGASAAERTVTYTVSTRGAVVGDLGHFADVAREALTDPRGWSLGGTLGFQQVASGSDFDLVLASPSVIAAASPGCSAQWSCRVGRSVFINDQRWRFGTSAWPHGLALYQRYVIQHEVGHWIGIPHTDCPTAGRTAWVMQQQSISLQGCQANVWPVIAERELAGSRMGVSVAWSAVEARYRALGQGSGLLGVPVTWEHMAPDQVGRYQHYSRPGGASIYWTAATGAHEVYGAIRGRWAETGWELGPLGYPVTGELGTPDGQGRFNHFSRPGGASIYWTAATGAHEVYGAIRGRWAETGWELGPLGYPVTGELGTPDGQGRFNHFSRPGGASIYWTAATGAHEVYGPIRTAWAETGWELGPLGYPTSGVQAVEGGSRVEFQQGHITLDDGTGETEVVLD
ncbi:DUF3152 domain-containing protein [Blastococcus capsensis]|uniref:DUF3152 domain-containing protein n=1 Tax=Blastococcus capsensis TaxID=1564163 RepID=UPI00253F656F|nr:DUF3152 domain-containing protein [Blastococcus capsensis]MDK3255190.1 DUF3152 domain-containing protein [Blastococcus capsensis]